MTTLEIARRDSVAGAIARNSAGYSIAPVAMIAPWPGISRGTDAVVPRVPGFVSEIVVPSKSDSLILPVRARVTTSSAAAAKLGERHRPDAPDVRHEERAGAVRLRDVHGETEADLVPAHARRLAARAVERVVHAGVRRRGRAGYRPRDRRA